MLAILGRMKTGFVTGWRTRRRLREVARLRKLAIMYKDSDPGLAEDLRAVADQAVEPRPKPSPETD